MLTVERLADGEVSPYLVEELVRGDEIELRGPIGGHFAWEQSLGGPLLLVAGGSGSCRCGRCCATGRPPRPACSATLRSRCISPSLVSGRTTGVGTARALIDACWKRIAWAPDQRPLICICGPTGFVEAVADGLVDSGHVPGWIRTERFGASGT